MVILSLLLLTLLTGCYGVHDPVRIALLAPFEGRYRDIGYSALYPARLALADSNTRVELLPIDDGGSVMNAIDRAKALSRDPRVRMVVVLGYDAADSQVQAAFGDTPMVIVGGWVEARAAENVFILSSADIPAELDSSGRLDLTDAARVAAPYTGGDVFALPGFVELRPDASGVTVLSSGSLPQPDFVQRIQASDPFAVSPGLLGTLTYDAVRMAVQTALTPDPLATLRAVQYEGLNGSIQFDASGFWRNAPINSYRYNGDGVLIPANPGQ
ncbi:MAG: hypothetical protein OHK0046_04600 [Anaerolineae bacterium]